ASPVREAAPMPPEVSAAAAEPPMEAVFIHELSASLLILSASFVPALPWSQSMTRVPAPPWRAPAPPAPPPVLPRRAPAPPAPPWWAPALLVMPQSLGPPHGPGPPKLALSRSRPTTPLDCCSVGASGSRSLGGGYVMNLVGDRSPPDVALALSLHTDCCSTPRTTSPIIHHADCANICGQSEALFKPRTFPCV
ncbi:hypothetical protein M9458_051322, partial [Cirrhinus mrigala]